MFKRIKHLYDMGRLDMKGMINAVDKGMITKQQFYEITGTYYDVATGTAPKDTEEEADEQ